MKLLVSSLLTPLLLRPSWAQMSSSAPYSRTPSAYVLPEGGTISQKLMLQIAVLNNEIMVIEFQVWCYASWYRVRSALYRRSQYTYCGRQDSHLVVHVTGCFLCDL